MKRRFTAYTLWGDLLELIADSYPENCPFCGARAMSDPFRGGWCANGHVYSPKGNQQLSLNKPFMAIAIDMVWEREAWIEEEKEERELTGENS